MRVTVIADASYCLDYRVAGYGYWIACERGRMPGGGAVRGKVASSLVAEMIAVVNALHDGLKYELIMKGDEVLFQTDCVGAIGYFERSVLDLPDTARHVGKAFYDLTSNSKLEVRFRHVKGHTTLKEARYAANRHCDQRAKQSMRQARRKAQQEELDEQRSGT